MYIDKRIHNAISKCDGNYSAGQNLLLKNYIAYFLEAQNIKICLCLAALSRVCKKSQFQCSTNAYKIKQYIN